MKGQDETIVGEGQGEGEGTGNKVNGNKDSANNNGNQNQNPAYEDEESTSEEDDSIGTETEEIVNASLVVNLSENNSHLNSLNSFSFRDTSQNPNSNASTISSSADDSSSSIDSPLASSRSAPPDLKDYTSSASVGENVAPRHADKENENKTSEVPSVKLAPTLSAVSSHDKPAFTSTPKQSATVLADMNGAGDCTPTSTNVSDFHSAPNIADAKKKLSVTFADIVKQGSGGGENPNNVSLPPYIVSEDEDGSEEEDLSESVYFSLGRTPPNATNGNGKSVEEDVAYLNKNEENKTTKDESSFDVSLIDRSELDIASVSARLTGHDNSSADTLINVSSWSNSVDSTATITPNVGDVLHGSGNVSDQIDIDRVSLDVTPNHNVDDDAADEEVHKINANLLLPNTVTELVASNGVKVYVIGTAHFSQQSQQDVIETIQKLQPSLVVLELCHSRRNILTLDEETILRESADMSFGKMKEAINQSGYVQGTLHLLLLSMSAQLTKKLGMAPGGEFRVAVQEARRVPGCLLLLGDRPFKVTLSRALAALSLGQKFKLAWQFLTSNDDVTKDEIERCKEKDLLEQMMMEMTGEFPAISKVFVGERDTYLAHSLWLAATSTSHSNQGQDIRGPIVGVVGMGHVAGIVKTWGNTTEEEIASLMIIPEPTLTSVIIRSTIKYSFYALLGFGAYKLSKRVFDFPSHGLIQSTWERLPHIVPKSISR